jgi:hypothetical protein
MEAGNQIQVRKMVASRLAMTTRVYWGMPHPDNTRDDARGERRLAKGSTPGEGMSWVW